jgi:hypothetical protein
MASGPTRQGGPASDIPPIRPGEIICPVCGWGNEPSRRFCRHDGAVLSAAGAGGTGQPPPMKAGQRNRRTTGSKKGWVALALLLPVLLAGMLVAGFLFLKPHGKHSPVNPVARTPAAKTPATQTPAAVPGTVLVPAGGVTISRFTSQSGDKVAANTIDGDPDTFWSAAYPSLIPGNPRPDIDRRPAIRYAFAPPVTLARLEIRNGASGDAFAKRPRANRIFVRFSDGGVQVATLDDDGTTFQAVPIKAPKKVSWVELQISTSYPGSATDDDRYRFSLAEVRFYRTA